MDDRPSRYSFSFTWGVSNVILLPSPGVDFNINPPFLTRVLYIQSPRQFWRIVLPLSDRWNRGSTPKPPQLIFRNQEWRDTFSAKVNNYCYTTRLININPLFLIFRN